MEPGAGRGVVVPPWQKDHAASRHPGARTGYRAAMSSGTINIARLPELLGKGERG